MNHHHETREAMNLPQQQHGNDHTNHHNETHVQHHEHGLQHEWLRQLLQLRVHQQRQLQQRGLQVQHPQSNGFRMLSSHAATIAHAHHDASAQRNHRKPCVHRHERTSNKHSLHTPNHSHHNKHLQQVHSIPMHGPNKKAPKRVWFDQEAMQASIRCHEHATTRNKLQKSSADRACHSERSKLWYTGRELLMLKLQAAYELRSQDPKAADRHLQHFASQRKASQRDIRSALVKASRLACDEQRISSISEQLSAQCRQRAIVDGHLNYVELYHPNGDVQSVQLPNLVGGGSSVRSDECRCAHTCTCTRTCSCVAEVGER